ncbi:MAG: hypothetical protein RMH77_03945 [Sulfolobales archaeon]|nr:hypothetical protein [Sulfolobales archaeon]MDW7969542.1 hypothetical protein [Sulfolobales archaeon]
MGCGMRLDLEMVMKIYEEHIDIGDVDKANLFVAFIVGFLAFIKYHKGVDEGLISDFAGSLRRGLVEGPDYLNPYIMELLGILEEEISEVTFNELITKLRGLLREERLDKLEV